VDRWPDRWRMDRHEEANSLTTPMTPIGVVRRQRVILVGHAWRWLNVNKLKHAFLSSASLRLMVSKLKLLFLVVFRKFAKSDY